MDYEDFVIDKTRITKERLNETARKSKNEYLARQMDISGARLYQQLSLTNERDKFHLENLPILLHVTGDFTILDMIEAMFGRVAFALPRPRADLEAVVNEQVKAIQEFGEYLTEVAEIVADGLVTDEEFAAVQKECGEAMAQMAALLETVRRLRRVRGHPGLKTVGEEQSD